MTSWDYAALDFSSVLDRPLTRNAIQKPATEEHQKIQADPRLKPWSDSPLASAAITLSLLEFAYDEDTDDIEEARLRWILKQAVLRAQIWQESAKRQISPDIFNTIQNSKNSLLGLDLGTRRDLVPPTEVELLLLRGLATQVVINRVGDEMALSSIGPSPSLRMQNGAIDHRPDLRPSKEKFGAEDGVAYPDIEEAIPPRPAAPQEDVHPVPRRKFR